MIRIPEAMIERFLNAFDAIPMTGGHRGRAALLPDIDIFMRWNSERWISTRQDNILTRDFVESMFTIAQYINEKRRNPADFLMRANDDNVYYRISHFPSEFKQYLEHAINMHEAKDQILPPFARKPEKLIVDPEEQGQEGELKQLFPTPPAPINPVQNIILERSLRNIGFSDEALRGEGATRH